MAKRLGFAAAFDWPDAWAVFREHAALSGFENNGERAFDISALADLSREQWQAMTPVRWPLSRTPDAPQRWRRLRMAPVAPQGMKAQCDALYPLVLNSGRIRDQWHTMTRTGNVPRLMQHISEPTVELAPGDAERLQLTDGGLCRIHSVRGVMVAYCILYVATYIRRFFNNSVV